jgi:threonine dehydrogenase-like Zn-dependent dehydrogenase
MKAVVWRGDMTIEIENVEDARIEVPTDVLMRTTSTAICGTDLHIYEGRIGSSCSTLPWSSTSWERPLSKALSTIGPGT